MPSHLEPVFFFGGFFPFLISSHNLSLHCWQSSDTVSKSSDSIQRFGKSETFCRIVTLQTILFCMSGNFEGARLCGSIKEHSSHKNKQKNTPVPMHAFQTVNLNTSVRLIHQLTDSSCHFDIIGIGRCLCSQGQLNKICLQTQAALSVWLL